MKKPYLALASAILISTVLSSAISTVSVQSNGGYDPLIDLNDDGTIDIFDIVAVALAFGASGTPINKTAVLLELQGRVIILEDEVAILRTEVDYLNASLAGLKVLVDTLNETLSTRLPKIGVVSIPAAAFVPGRNTVNARNLGYQLYNADTVFVVHFYAPVQLPQGVTITNFTTYWYDTVSENITCRLRYGGELGSLGFMADADSHADSGYGSSFDDTIIVPTIDNTEYNYFVQVTFQPNVGNSLRFYQAIIEYEYPDP
jgi:hypothetical protein